MAMNPRLLRPRATGYDPAAQVYFNAVAIADGQQLEPAVKKAINDFVVGCKRDGIWSSIKASCLLMGARTLSGALTPLVGNSVTNNGPFVSGDYNRKTGLLGNGTSKYLTTTNPATPQQNSAHQSCYISTNTASPADTFVNHVGEWPTSGTDGRTQLSSSSGRTFTRCRETTGNTVLSTSTGFLGISRSVSANYTLRRASSDATITAASSGVPNQSVFVFANPAGAQFSDARLAFFSIGESLTLSSLDSRVSALYTAIGAAIP